MFDQRFVFAASEQKCQLVAQRAAPGIACAGINGCRLSVAPS